MAIYKISDYQDDLQAAFNAAAEDSRPTIDLEYHTIVIDECVMPFPKSGRVGNVINGYINIEKDKDGIIPNPNIRELNVSTGVQGGSIVNLFECWNFLDLEFRGGRDQLVLAAQKFNKIRCRFSPGSSYGIPRNHLTQIFCMNMDFSNSHFQFCTGFSVVNRTAVSIKGQFENLGLETTPMDDAWFVGLTATNCQSNENSARKCYFFGMPGNSSRARQKGFIFNHGSNGLKLTESTMEGAAPDYLVWADGAFSNTVKSIEIDLKHVETSFSMNNLALNSIAMVYVRAIPDVIINIPYIQTRRTTVIKAVEGVSRIVINNPSWIPFDANTFDIEDDKTSVHIIGMTKSSNNIVGDSVWSNKRPNYVRLDQEYGTYYIGKKGGSIVAKTSSQETSVRLATNLVDVRNVNTLFLPDSTKLIYRKTTTAVQKMFKRAFSKLFTPKADEAVIEVKEKREATQEREVNVTPIMRRAISENDKISEYLEGLSGEIMYKMAEELLKENS